MSRDAAYILDIVRFGREIIEFVRGFDEAGFVADRRVQSAVMYNITIIGEAVKGLSPDFRDRHPQIPWRQIAGMRDKLVRDYRQINVVQVWRVVRVDIPELLDRLEPLLPNQSRIPCFFPGGEDPPLYPPYSPPTPSSPPNRWRNLGGNRGINF